jgi:DNA-binding HxlR family transcriptional regulator
MKDAPPVLCAQFHTAVELIGRRWSGAIIRLLLERRLRYSDLKAAVPDISDRMLSERLKELEAESIVTRIVTPDTPVRVEYELTAKGRALEEPLRTLGAWASTWVRAG